MTLEQCGKLFQAFSQADGSTTRKYGGTGLGLSISQRLVELMGGKIQVQTTIEQGSTFHFDLDFQASNEVAPLPPAALPNLRVLVLDDNRSARHILAQTLGEVGMRVDLTLDALGTVQAVARADATDPYQLILADWRMPQSDSISVIHSIRNNLNLKHQPHILLMTAFGQEEIQSGPRLRVPRVFCTNPSAGLPCVIPCRNYFPSNTNRCQPVRRKTAVSSGAYSAGRR